jgi:hypothetical protein
VVVASKRVKGKAGLWPPTEKNVTFYSDYIIQKYLPYGKECGRRYRIGSTDHWRYSHMARMRTR